MARPSPARSTKLLEEAQAEVQARSLHPERLELSELLRMTAKGFALVSAHEVRFDGADDVWARADRAALNHALGNLIDNAIKFSPDGGPVTLRLRPTSEHVEIDVTDQGVDSATTSSYSHRFSAAVTRPPRHSRVRDSVCT